MPFVPDKTAGFVPDKPKATKGFIPDGTAATSSFVHDTKANSTEGLFGTKLGTAERPLWGTGLLARAVGVPKEDAATALLTAAREPGRRSREGFNTLTDTLLPATNSSSIVKSNSDITRDVLRGMFQGAGDFMASSIDPESGLVASIGPTVKLFSTPVSKAAKYIGGKIAEKAPALARPFVYRFGQPELYKELADTRIGKIGLGAEKAQELGSQLSEGLSKVEQLRAAQIMKGSISVSKREAGLRKAALSAREELIRAGGEAVDQGLLNEDTYYNNLKTYMPRFYRAFEEKASGLSELFGSKPQRIGGQRFLKRGEITEEMRKFLGEIKEPAYPVARGIAQLTHDVETAKLFHAVADNPSWSSIKAVEGFTKMESTKRLGPLAGKWVHPEIARDINEMIRVPTYAEKVYKDILHAWKFGKVVLNPATHARNMMSNAILMDLSGIELHQQPALLAKAAKEMANKGKYFTEAKDALLLGHEFSNAEIKGFIDNFAKPADTVIGKLLKIPAKIAKKTGGAYQTEEKVFKLAKYIHGREAGLGVKEAAQEAEKWLFNYDKVPPIVKALRNSPIGAPFVTFTSKALPVVAEAAVKNPMRLYKYKILFDSLENMAREKFDLKEGDIDTIKRNQRGKVVILPFKDKQGSLQTLDLSYILPWGDVGEQGGLGVLPPAVSPGGLLKPIGEIYGNKSLFKAAYYKYDPSKAQIYLDSDSELTKNKKRADYLYKAYMPSFAPPIPGVSSGGYHTEKLIRAQEGRLDYFGRVRDVSTVLADVMLGLKVSPVDPELMKRFERTNIAKELAEVRAEVVGKFRNRGATQEEKQKARDIFAEKIQKILIRKSRMEQ